MGEGKLGRYCEQAKRWLIPEVWKKWWRKKEKIIQNGRAYCKSKSDEQRAACGCRKKKTSESKYWPTPSRAATFAPKRKKKSRRISGENSMVKQAQRNYTGSYISGDLGGVKV